MSSQDYDFCVPEAQRLADITATLVDLKRTASFCEVAATLDRTDPGCDFGPPTQTSQLYWWDHVFLYSIATLAIFGRSLGSGCRAGIKPFVSSMSPAWQKQYEYFKTLRDKWAAHPVNWLNSATVSVRVPNDDLARARVVTDYYDIPGLAPTDFTNLRKLCLILARKLEVEAAREEHNLQVLVQKESLDDLKSRGRARRPHSFARSIEAPRKKF